MWLVLILVSSVWAIYRLLDRKPKNFPPGPFNIPFIGSLEQLYMVNALIHRNFKRLGRKYGDLIFFKLLGDKPVLVIRGYNLVKKAMQMTDFSGVGEPITFKEHGLHRRLGLIFTDGARWQKSRRFALRALHEQGMGRQKASDALNEELQHVIDHFKSAAGRDVSVTGTFSVSTLNVMLQMSIGEKMPRSGEVLRLKALVDRTVIINGPSSLHLELFPWLAKVAPVLSGFKAFRQDVHDILYALQPQIERHQSQFSEQNEPQDLVDAFLLQQKTALKSGDEDDAQVFSEDNLRAILKDLMMAGLEATGTAMEWMVLLLSLHPNVQQKLFQEIDDKIGRDRQAEVGDMTDMVYTRAVQDEVLRYTSIIPITQHAINFGDISFEGYDVPNGCRIMFDIDSILHDDKFWGDPGVFRPERFLGGDAARLRERLVPFGMGLRRCIGEAHTKQTMFLFTVGLVQKLKFSSASGPPPSLEPEPGMALHPQPFEVRVELRH